MSEVQNIVREFVHTLSRVEYLEHLISKCREELKEKHELLVRVCPHAEAIDRDMNIRGWGRWRVCKACGLEDHALIGATSGDEYDYGYAGHVDENFWAGTDVEVAKNDKEFNKYRKSHDWQVVNGEPVNK
jgi:hypothetical protein